MYYCNSLIKNVFCFILLSIIFGCNNENENLEELHENLEELFKKEIIKELDLPRKLTVSLNYDASYTKHYKQYRPEILLYFTNETYQQAVESLHDNNLNPHDPNTWIDHVKGYKYHSDTLFFKYVELELLPVISPYTNKTEFYKAILIYELKDTATAKKYFTQMVNSCEYNANIYYKSDKLGMFASDINFELKEHYGGNIRISGDEALFYAGEMQFDKITGIINNDDKEATVEYNLVIKTTPFIKFYDDKYKAGEDILVKRKQLFIKYTDGWRIVVK